MPTLRLDTKGTVIRKYDVAGEDAEGLAAGNFVSHVALALDEGAVASLGTNLNVAHMKPPHRSHGQIQVHVIGSVPLTIDEQNQIGLFIRDVEPEQKAAMKLAKLRGEPTVLCQYVIRPHADAVRARDGTIIHRRFSCAGYVIEAYREAHVDLLDTREKALPPVGADVIGQGFPGYEELRNSPGGRAVLASCGLDGKDGWRVVLPGYVLNALNRAESDIRQSAYRVTDGDQTFPRSA